MYVYAQKPKKKRQYGTFNRDLQQTQKLQHDTRGP